ncbi:hypothetical protein BOX15_Mlig004030g1 [Macrostomum lignano]|uniref:Anion exchange protein n=1 Tax=Macrostomum lignano TaxID=282301 RepID=A0A267H8E1_9PLAT|nr:hypothetical protein BOX15_Mlig004030g1 [Macrostomum lignano]
MSDEPVPDSGRYAGYGLSSDERVADEVSSHRRIPAGRPTAVLVGVRLPQDDDDKGGDGKTRKKRRRRERLRRGSTSIDEPDGGAANEPAPDPNSTDPSARVQFLLGNLDEDGETGEESEVHPIFCEMDELFKSDSAGELQWRETARWVKFEEDVEEGGERWSKPHVATLSLFSLFEVRNSIHRGEILLDCEGQTMEAISDLLTERLVHAGKLSESLRPAVAEVLLKRHSHLYERKARGGSHLGAKIRSFADIGRKFSSKDLEKDASGHALGSRGDLAAGESPEPADLHHSGSGHKFDQHFMKKVPPGAETSNILVGSTDFLDRSLTVFIRLRHAVILGDITEIPVPTRFIYVLLGPPGQTAHFHEMGRSMATLMSDEIFHDVAYLARNKDDLLSGVDEFLKSCTVLPPNEWDPSIRIEPPKEVPSQEPRKQGSLVNAASASGGLGSDHGGVEDTHVSGGSSGGHGAPGTSASAPADSGESGTGGANGSGSGGGGGGGGDGDAEGGHGSDPSLTMTGRPFGGLILDVKRKAPFYVSDFKDALHAQSLGALLFLYFACLTPIITFGGLLVDATEGHLGAIESILSGAICGTSFALCSGQPLTILGSTGPVLVFETIVFKMCKDYDWDYLSFRMWTGLYISLILLLFVAFDLSALVKYITRFTEESFAGLIALIFIVEAVKKLLFIGKEYPVNRAWHPTYATKFDCRCYRKSTLNDTDWKPLKPGQHLRLPSYKPNGSEVYYANYSGFNYWSWNWYETNRACENNQGEWRGEGCGSYFVPDVFFFSCLLFIGTFAISYGLKMMRNSCFFPNRVRSIISDFAVMLAIVAMTGADLALGLHTPKLNVPERFEPTLGYATRGWLIKPLGNRGQNPWYTIIIAVFPALLATILIFMDQQITAVIVNRKENRLKKGKGYHLDLLVVAVLIGINSVLGIPWFVAATVLSINHVISLKIESESTAPGERPKFLGCRENRLTGFLIFLLIGLSVFMTPILKHIPMPVLYGVFLFMGISSLNGLQLVQRTGLFFMPQKYQPDYIFLRHVKIGQVHKFTVIQIACLVVLWVVKAIKAISILFPIMVLAMCFIRKALDFVFDQSELKWIDDIMPPITVSLGRKRNSGDEGGAASGAPGAASSGRQPITIELDMDLKQPAATQHFNVSNEVDRTSIWKNLTGAGGNADGGKSSKKQNKRSSKKTSSSSAAGGNEDVGGAGKLDDADKEAAEALLKMPEIVVEPPSGCNSPERRSSNA